MHREHDGDDRKGKDVHCRGEIFPFTFRSAEANGQRFCKILSSSQPVSTVTRHCQIRDERQEQIHGAAQKIGCDRQEVPHQGRVEVGPDHALIWNRKHPVRQPDTPQVHEDAKSSLDQAKGGHQLCRTCERAAGFHFQDSQNGGDECARMADTDPKHGIDQEHAPVIWTGNTCHALTLHDEHIPFVSQTKDNDNRQDASHHPEYRMGLVHRLHDHRVHLTAWQWVIHQMFARVFFMLFSMRSAAALKVLHSSPLNTSCQIGYTRQCFKLFMQMTPTACNGGLAYL